MKTKNTAQETIDRTDANGVVHGTFVHPKSGNRFPFADVPCADCETKVRMHPDSYASLRGELRCVSCGSNRHIAQIQSS